LAVVIDSSSEVCTHTKSERDSVKIIRKATEDDQKKFSWLQRKEKRAFEFCLERIKERNLPMKLVMVQKAKKQQIVINPTKISGLCGRLMCCLAFEDESLGRLYAEEEKVEED
jgi:cell fate regulator YaaT (PSP1 superfamily)